MQIDQKYITRFWERINKSGPILPHMDTPCWIWKGTTDKAGYGVLKLSNQNISN